MGASNKRTGAHGWPASPLYSVLLDGGWGKFILSVSLLIWLCPFTMEVETIFGDRLKILSSDYYMGGSSSL